LLFLSLPVLLDQIEAKVVRQALLGFLARLWCLESSLQGDVGRAGLRFPFHCGLLGTEGRETLVEELLNPLGRAAPRFRLALAELLFFVEVLFGVASFVRHGLSLLSWVCESCAHRA
jgi:hypothetical protein